VSSLPGFVTAKYDTDGNQLWRNVFAGGVINEAAGTAVTPAGEVAVVGRSNTSNAYDIATDTAQTSCVDVETPLLGQALVYMVRPANMCGVGEWGSGTNGEARATICP